MEFGRAKRGRTSHLGHPQKLRLHQRQQRACGPTTAGNSSRGSHANRRHRVFRPGPSLWVASSAQCTSTKWPGSCTRGTIARGRSHVDRGCRRCDERQRSDVRHLRLGRKPTATSARSVLTPTRKATAGPMLSAAFTRADTGKKLGGGGARRGHGWSLLRRRENHAVKNR